MRWKTLMGRCIYQTDSDIRVLDNGLFRWLRFDSEALQTLLFKPFPQVLGLNYLKPFLLAAKTTPGHTCLLGLGGAGAAHALNASLDRFRLVAVEYSEEVIHIAKKYFKADTLDNLNIVHQEASHFIGTGTEKFHHLLVDLSTAHEFPKQCLTDKFFAQCSQRLTVDGFISVNLANRKEHRPVLELMKAHFKFTLAIPIKKYANMIIVANNDYAQLLAVLEKSRLLKEVYWDPYWGLAGSY